MENNRNNRIKGYIFNKIQRFYSIYGFYPAEIRCGKNAYFKVIKFADCTNKIFGIVVTKSNQDVNKCSLLYMKKPILYEMTFCL